MTYRQMLEAKKKWREKNKEHIKAYNKKYAKKNRAALNAKARERYNRLKEEANNEQ